MNVTFHVTLVGADCETYGGVLAVVHVGESLEERLEFQLLLSPRTDFFTIVVTAAAGWHSSPGEEVRQLH
jgi:hypothetical protein